MSLLHPWSELEVCGPFTPSFDVLWNVNKDNAVTFGVHMLPKLIRYVHKQLPCSSSFFKCFRRSHMCHMRSYTYLVLPKLLQRGMLHLCIFFKLCKLFRSNLEGDTYVIAVLKLPFAWKGNFIQPMIEWNKTNPPCTTYGSYHCWWSLKKNGFFPVP